MLCLQVLLCVLMLGDAKAQQLVMYRKLLQSSTQQDGRLPSANIVIGILSVVAVVIALLLAGLAYLKARFFSRGLKCSAGSRSSPLHFSSKALAKSTGNFSDKIGVGVLGSTFKGLLQDSKRTPVAVKRLEGTNFNNHEDFDRFVKELSSVAHVNLVKFYGYCSGKGAEKFLVYEFLPNGSLDTVLFADETHGLNNWKFKSQVALSIARCISHLHQQQPPFVHGNIKVENVLLDDSFHPKVSDAGLSSLMNRKKVVSGLKSGHGLYGYFSPEWAADAPLTRKSDVYSFGMVLLEIVAGRRALDLTRGREEWNLVELASKQKQVGSYGDVVEQSQAKSFVTVALRCVQEEAEARPSMAQVVQMLEEATTNGSEAA